MISVLIKTNTTPTKTTVWRLPLTVCRFLGFLSTFWTKISVILLGLVLQVPFKFWALETKNTQKTETLGNQANSQQKRLFPTETHFCNCSTQI